MNDFLELVNVFNWRRNKIVRTKNFMKLLMDMNLIQCMLNQSRVKDKFLFNYNEGNTQDILSEELIKTVTMVLFQIFYLEA